MGLSEHWCNPELEFQLRHKRICSDCTAGMVDVSDHRDCHQSLPLHTAAGRYRHRQDGPCIHSSAQDVPLYSPGRLCTRFSGGPNVSAAGIHCGSGCADISGGTVSCLSIFL